MISPNDDRARRFAQHDDPDGCAVSVDGVPVVCRAGVPLAVALLEAGVAHLRDSPTAGAPRGAFCMMGVCQECVAQVDGVLVQTCLVPVRAGHDVRRFLKGAT